MEEIERVSLKCEHCGHEFTNKAPKAPGKYYVPCKNPECREPVHFVYKGTKLNNEGESKKEVKYGFLDNGAYRFKCGNTSCGQSVLVPADKIKVGNNMVICPKCNTSHEFEKKPTEADLLKCQTAGCEGTLEKPGQGDGVFTTTCDKCQAEYSLIVNDGKVTKVTMKTPPPAPPTKQYKMKLVVSRLFGKDEYILKKGTQYVGRADEDGPSDFQVKDKYASKRSLRIDVNENGGELVYKLTVERATNPVYHNNRELSENDIIYITYGDTLKIGKTLIKVQKVVK